MEPSIQPREGETAPATVWRCTDCCETFLAQTEPTECPSCGAGPTWIFEDDTE